jgi:hypothetical protein
METILIIVTFVSVAAAAAAFTSAHRAKRREQERSEARVAALQAAAEMRGAAYDWQWKAEPDGNAEPAPPLPAGPSRTTAGLAEDFGEGGRIPAGSMFATQANDSRIQAENTFGTEGMFGTVQREEPARGRLLLAAATVLIILLGGAFVFLSTSGQDDHLATEAAITHPDPLELVSLGHAREARVLTIRGTIRNPSSGSKVEGLTAVVSLLDNKGELISTKDVPLDYRALGPGEEAPFKVSVPDVGSIARYRVSFRAGTDVVPHIDRRGDTKLASSLR